MAETATATKRAENRPLFVHPDKPGRTRRFRSSSQAPSRVDRLGSGVASIAADVGIFGQVLIDLRLPQGRLEHRTSRDL
jgi:hypothetical protein